MSESSSIGILGGSFDPVHNGHLAMAQLAAEHFGLSRVLFVPAGIPPHKSRTVRASARDRLAMLHEATVGNPLFALCDIELQRSGKSYTVDTIRALRDRSPSCGLYFIIGSDNLKEIRTWHEYKAILLMVTLCVAHRPGYSMRVPKQVRGARVRPFPSPEWALSSTRIRGLLREGHSCRHLLPAPVVDYIESNALYR